MKHLLAAIPLLWSVNVALAQQGVGSPPVFQTPGPPSAGNFTGTLPAANGGTGEAGTITGALKGNGTSAVTQAASTDLSDTGAWTAYSPAVTCGAGTLTTASVTGRSKTILGKITFVEMKITLTSVGTCASFLQVTLPITANSSAALVGKDIAVNNVAFIGGIDSTLGAGAIAAFLPASGTFAVSNGQVIVVSGVYENQ